MTSLQAISCLLRHSRGAFFVYLWLMISALTCTVSSLSCVQCVSLDNSNCVNGAMTPKPCTGEDYGSTYCLKSVGSQVSGHGHFVFRSCSKTLETNCTRMYAHGDLYNVCHSSCTEDGCNGATSLRADVSFLIAVFVTSITVALLTACQLA